MFVQMWVFLEVIANFKLILQANVRLAYISTL
jgi:hypothetical protein